MTEAEMHQKQVMVYYEMGYLCGLADGLEMAGKVEMPKRLRRVVAVIAAGFEGEGEANDPQPEPASPESYAKPWNAPEVE